MKKFSLVSTVFNEKDRIDATIQDIENQSLKPDEIIITDAGSNDGTFERLKKWEKDSSIKIKILQRKGANVAEGRNLAIAEASNELIVSTDFGCRFHPDWLMSLITPFENPEVSVTGGNYSVKEDEIISLAAKGTYVICNGYHQSLDESFIPSSRSIAYYKNVWKDIGGYPEWLTLAGDDLVFGKLIRKKAYKIHLVYEGLVYWGRHVSAKAYGKEAFRYGLGDGEAGLNLRSAISKFIEGSARYVFLIAALILVLPFTKPTIPYTLGILFLGLISLRSYYWAFKNWLRLKSSKYNLWVLFFSFYLIELSRWQYLKGYIKGYFFSSLDQKKESKKLKALLNANPDL
jgi:glycosyltransferase involved in cell wall biosynthesis